VVCRGPGATSSGSSGARKRCGWEDLGAIGTFAHVDPDVEEEVCRLLGLEPDPISTQVVQRDRHAELCAVLAIVAASLEKVAVEIRSLQRTEILEVEERSRRARRARAPCRTSATRWAART